MRSEQDVEITRLCPGCNGSGVSIPASVIAVRKWKAINSTIITRQLR